MKTLKLNQLEKSEMNVVRGGEPLNICSAQAHTNMTEEELKSLFAHFSSGICWEDRWKTWGMTIYK